MEKKRRIRWQIYSRVPIQRSKEALQGKCRWDRYKGRTAGSWCSYNRLLSASSTLITRLVSRTLFKMELYMWPLWFRKIFWNCHWNITWEVLCVCVRMDTHISRQAGKNNSDGVRGPRHVIWWLIQEIQWVRSQV